MPEHRLAGIGWLRRFLTASEKHGGECDKCEVFHSNLPSRKHEARTKKGGARRNRPSVNQNLVVPSARTIAVASTIDVRSNRSYGATG